MTLADYLAKNYLAAEKPSKKRKRKSNHAQHDLTIADDDDQTWNLTTHEGSDDDVPVVVGHDAGQGISESGKKRKWIKIGEVHSSEDAEQATANAIIAEVTQNRQDEDEEEPVVIGNEYHDHGGQKLASGTLAGLNGDGKPTKVRTRKDRMEKKAMEVQGLDPSGKAQETIYRDASGRIINVAMKRAEARQKAEELERKAVEEKEAAKGDVQRREKEERRQLLQEMQGMPIARYASDEKLNEEQKRIERWNDPMAAMPVTEKRPGTGKHESKKGNEKMYHGAYEPNRYGIRPGWRWDGVDRGNGFERKWFAARNRQASRQELEYMWQMDD